MEKGFCQPLMYYYRTLKHLCFLAGGLGELGHCQRPTQRLVCAAARQMGTESSKVSAEGRHQWQGEDSAEERKRAGFSLGTDFGTECISCVELIGLAQT